MAIHALNQAIRRTLFRVQSGNVADSDLLQRFVARQEEAAFEELVRRHGPMVLRLCQQVLRQPQDAEDAFQATFIVLAKKATAIAKMGSVGSWLHKVAYRIALRARAAAVQCPVRSGRVEQVPDPGAAESVAADVRMVLDEELCRLPERYRAPMVLCYLEGKTTDQTAEQLGWKRGTVASRLSRARDLLRDRLARRGVAYSGATFGAAATQEALGAGLTRSLVLAAPLLATGRSLPLDVVSTRAGALADELLRTMAATRLRRMAVFVLLIAFAGGISLLAVRTRSTPSPTVSPDAGSRPLRAALEGHTDRVYSLAFSHDSRTLVSAGLDQVVKVWDAGTTTERMDLRHRGIPADLQRPRGDEAGLAEMDRRNPVAGTIYRGLMGDKPVYIGTDAASDALVLAKDYTVYALAVSPDGQTVVSGSWFGVTTVWDVPTRKARARFMGHNRNTITVAYAPDGQCFASGGWDGLVKVWDAATLRAKTVCGGHTAHIWSVAFSPDGKNMASGSYDRTVKVWDVATGQLRSTLQGHTDGIYSVRFSPDGRTIASASLDRTIRLWDVATARERAVLTGHTDAVHAVGFSPDGKTLASGSFDRTVRLWDLTTGRSITLGEHADRVTIVAFAPDGKKLASGGYDRTVRLWMMGEPRSH